MTRTFADVWWERKVKETVERTTAAWGVYPHAVEGKPTGRGYVARRLDHEGKPLDMRNYGALQPVAVFKRERDAIRRADKLTDERGREG